MNDLYENLLLLNTKNLTEVEVLIIVGIVLILAIIILTILKKFKDK